MSRGPGRWQRELLRATSGELAVAVSGVVKATVLAPSRDDFVAARRGAKGLALAERVSAVYLWTCARCMRIQDRDDPALCCGSARRPVRPMLAVCQPERLKLLPRPAPPPVGRVPSWVNVAVVPPRRPGLGGEVTAADLADLVLRRCYEGLQSGAQAVSVQAYATVARLAWQMERDEAIPARDKALAELDEAMQAVEVLRSEIVRKHGYDEWWALAGKVKEQMESDRQTRAMRERIDAMAGVGLGAR